MSSSRIVSVAPVTDRPAAVVPDTVTVSAPSLVVSFVGVIEKLPVPLVAAASIVTRSDGTGS